MLPVTDATLEDFLEMEMDRFIPQVDYDEEERCSKMVKTTNEYKVSASGMDIEVFIEKISVLVNDSSSNLQVALDSASAAPSSLAEYQKLHEALGQEYADRISVLVETEKIHKAEI